MLNSKFDIFFKIGNDNFLGASIRATHQKVELFYHYPWGSKSKATYSYIGDRESYEGYLPDHISFPKDGNIHSKARNGTKKKIYHNTLNPGINVFNLERGHFLPIFIESINLKDDNIIEKRFKKAESIDKTKSALLDITGLAYFSIILISKCERVNPQNLIKDHGFENLTIVGSPIILTDIFKDEDKKGTLSMSSGYATQLVIMVVQEVWNDVGKTMGVKKNGENGIKFSTTICMPPMDLIGRMINMNKS